MCCELHKKAIEKIFFLEQRIDAVTTAITSIAASRGNGTLTPQDDAANLTPVNLNASAFLLTLDASLVLPQARHHTTISLTPTQNPYATFKHS